MLSLGIESTAHTFGIGIIDEKGKVYSNARDIYRPDAGGIHPSKAREHHKAVCETILQKALI